MRVLPIMATLALAVLAGCARDGMNRSYAGSPHSTYDVATNPPQANGTVTYDATNSPEPYDYGNSGDASVVMRAH